MCSKYQDIPRLDVATFPVYDEGAYERRSWGIWGDLSGNKAPASSQLPSAGTNHVTLWHSGTMLTPYLAPISWDYIGPSWSLILWTLCGKKCKESGSQVTQVHSEDLRQQHEATKLLNSDSINNSYQSSGAARLLINPHVSLLPWPPEWNSMKCPLMPHESVLDFSQATSTMWFSLESLCHLIIESGLGLSCPISSENYCTPTETECKHANSKGAESPSPSRQLYRCFYHNKRTNLQAQAAGTCMTTKPRRHKVIIPLEGRNKAGNRSCSLPLVLRAWSWRISG